MPTARTIFRPAPLPLKVGKLWYQDAQTLDRILEVEQLDLAGESAPTIARKLGVHQQTVLLDLRRLVELRHARFSTDEMIAKRNRSIAQYRKVQHECWGRISVLPAGSRVVAELLNQVNASEREITKLEGTITHVAPKETFNQDIHVQILNDLGERLAAQAVQNGAGDLLRDALPGTGPGLALPLAGVGTTEPDPPRG